MRAVSGIEMALWDLAGKALGVPTVTLLGGRFRDRVRVYDHAAPRNMLDKASCREWAQKVKSDPSGFTAHKFGFPLTSTPNRPRARSQQSRALHQGTDPDPPGLRELPRGHRLGPRHHGPLPLGATICALPFNWRRPSRPSSRCGSKIRCPSITPIPGSGWPPVPAFPSAPARTSPAGRASRTSSSTRAATF